MWPQVSWFRNSPKWTDTWTYFNCRTVKSVIALHTSLENCPDATYTYQDVLRIKSFSVQHLQTPINCWESSILVFNNCRYQKIADNILFRCSVYIYIYIKSEDNHYPPHPSRSNRWLWLHTVLDCYYTPCLTVTTHRAWLWLHTVLDCVYTPCLTVTIHCASRISA